MRATTIILIHYADGASTRRTPTLRAVAAFTLLEVMLAVTIFGIVATSVYGTFSRTLRSKTIAEDRMSVMRTGRAALTRMGDEIAAAVYREPQNGPNGSMFSSLTGGTETTPLDSLVFSTLATSGVGGDDRRTDQKVVVYFFPEDRSTRTRRGGRRDGASAAGTQGGSAASAERGSPFSASSGGDADGEVFDFFAGFGARSLRTRGIEAERLLRREAPLIQEGAFDQEGGLDTAVPMVFLDEVASLEFRFFDGSEWVDAWNSEDRDTYPDRLPRAVAIDLALYDRAGEIHHFATAIDLALASPIRRGPAPAGSRSPSAPRPTPGGAS